MIPTEADDPIAGLKYTDKLYGYLTYMNAESVLILTGFSLAEQFFDILDALHSFLFITHHAQGACTSNKKSV